MTQLARMQDREFKGIRVEVDTPAGFDEVRSRLRNLMGNANVPAVLGLASQVSGKEEYEREVQRQFVGESGFMLFAEIDHGAWISVYGIHRRTVRWILGNPLIAITMIRHDLIAGLFAPVELLLIEKERGAGTVIVYVLPSSLISIDESNIELRTAALRVAGARAA